MTTVSLAERGAWLRQQHSMSTEQHTSDRLLTAEQRIAGLQHRAMRQSHANTSFVLWSLLNTLVNLLLIVWIATR